MPRLCNGVFPVAGCHQVSGVGRAYTLACTLYSQIWSIRAAGPVSVNRSAGETCGNSIFRNDESMMRRRHNARRLAEGLEKSYLHSGKLASWVRGLYTAIGLLHGCKGGLDALWQLYMPVWHLFWYACAGRGNMKVIYLIFPLVPGSTLFC